MSYAQAHRRAKALFNTDTDHAAYLSTKVGYTVTAGDIEALRSSFLPPLQRAYIESVGYHLSLNPRRRSSRSGS